MLTVGMSLLYLASARLGDTIDHWLLSGPLLVSGFGMGIAISSLFQAVLASVSHRDAGSGSGALQSFQQIGSHKLFGLPLYFDPGEVTVTAEAPGRAPFRRAVRLSPDTTTDRPPASTR
jgi:hypothetical protein